MTGEASNDAGDAAGAAWPARARRAFTRFADRIAAYSGWRRYGLAGLCGALSVLALAPFNIAPVLFLSVPVLVWLLDGCLWPAEAAATERGLRARLTRAAATGWAFGFGYFVAGLYWVGGAFLVEAERFAWLLPFAVAALPAGLALFWGAGAALAVAVWQPGWRRVVLLAAALTLTEYARGHVLTGLPWNLPGYALTSNLAILQAASVVGIYGLTALTFLIFGAPAAIVTADRGCTSRRIGIGYPAAMAAMLTAIYAGGTWRLATVRSAEVDDVTLRIVQPNIAQTDKWSPQNRNAIFARYLALSRKVTARRPDGIADVSHLIWPESALPFALAETPNALDAIAALLPADTILITGQARVERGRPGTRTPDVYNSVMVFDEEAKLVGLFDKIHLVPFGEYLPFQSLLEAIGLEQLTRIRGGFREGSKPRILHAPGVPPVSPLVCYEAIFPGEVVGKGERPGWLLNVTNDAWFGRSTGPYQHLQQARVRAVEQGLPLVRAANTGISAIVDPFGRIVSYLDLGREDVIDGALPASLPGTPYSRFHNYSWAPLLLILCIFLFWNQRHIKRNR